MTLQTFHFETADGARVGKWTVRDTGNPMERNHRIGTLLVIGGKRFVVAGHRRPTVYSEAWDRILIVNPHTP